MNCRGTETPDFKSKQIIRPSQVFEHHVHYSILKTDGTKNLLTVALNRTTEIRIAHLRSVHLGGDLNLQDHDAFNNYWIPHFKEWRSSAKNPIYIQK